MERLRGKKQIYLPKECDCQVGSFSLYTEGGNPLFFTQVPYIIAAHCSIPPRIDHC